MRQIKFRGRFGLEWYYGYAFQDSEGTYILERNGMSIGYSQQRINAITLGQFTGIKDSKGEEIFEGDILKVREDFYEPHFVRVVYCGNRNYPAFEIENSKGDRGEDNYNGLSYYKDNGYLEVVGNIYDNPELLKESKND